jgi:hypothetical protein
LRAENAGYTNYAENGNIISENIGFTNTPAMIGATSNNLIGAVVINGATSNFKGRILEFRIYQGAPAPLDTAVLGAYGPDRVGVDCVLHDFPETNSLTITWGLTATNVILETSPVPGEGAIWNQVPITPSLQNWRLGASVPLIGDAAFFRLHAP